jgi:hypothetical protein
MFCPMNRIKRAAISLGATTLLASTCANLWADAKVNPYEPIAERNPFGLKPPPPPPDPSENVPKPPPVPLATVDLTGITSILGPPRALLEIVPGPGKPMIKPVLAEGERVESIEVVSINIQKNEVTIKNGPTVTNLTFKVAKSTPAAAAPPPAGGLPGMVPKPPVPGLPGSQPTQTSYNNPGSGRYNVMVAGGSSSAPAAATATGAPYGSAQNTGGNGVNPGYGGVNPGAAALGGGTDGGFRSIPSRNMRTAGQPEADPAVSRMQTYEEIEQNRAKNYLQEQLTGKRLPPLPGTPITPPDAPGVNPRPNLPPLPGQTRQ